MSDYRCVYRLQVHCQSGHLRDKKASIELGDAHCLRAEMPSSNEVQLAIRHQELLPEKEMWRRCLKIDKKVITIRDH